MMHNTVSLSAISFTGIEQRTSKNKAINRDNSASNDYTSPNKEQVRKACRKSFWLGAISTAALFIVNAIADNHFAKKEAEEIEKILGKGSSPKKESYYPFKWFIKLFKK